MLNSEGSIAEGDVVSSQEPDDDGPPSSQPIGHIIIVGQTSTTTLVQTDEQGNHVDGIIVGANNAPPAFTFRAAAAGAPLAKRSRRAGGGRSASHSDFTQHDLDAALKMTTKIRASLAAKGSHLPAVYLPALAAGQVANAAPVRPPAQQPTTLKHNATVSDIQNFTGLSKTEWRHVHDAAQRAARDSRDLSFYGVKIAFEATSMGGTDRTVTLSPVVTIVERTTPWADRTIESKAKMVDAFFSQLSSVLRSANPLSENSYRPESGGSLGRGALDVILSRAVREGNKKVLPGVLRERVVPTMLKTVLLDGFIIGDKIQSTLCLTNAERQSAVTASVNMFCAANAFSSQQADACAAKLGMDYRPVAFKAAVKAAMCAHNIKLKRHAEDRLTLDEFKAVVEKVIKPPPKNTSVKGSDTMNWNSTIRLVRDRNLSPR